MDFPSFPRDLKTAPQNMAGDRSDAFAVSFDELKFL